MARINLRSCIWLAESDLLAHVLVNEDAQLIAVDEPSPAALSAALSCNSTECFSAPLDDQNKKDE
jgi:hypothetical protein